MTVFKEKMIQDMKLRNFSSRTQVCYLRHIEHFEKFFDSDADSLNSDHIREFLAHAIDVRNLSTGYVNQAYSALRFFFESTLDQHWDIKHIPRAKKQKKLPIILSKEEIQAIFDRVNNLKHKAIFYTIYGGGLRVSEVVRLRVKDIDSYSMKIIVNQSKGYKDRHTLLSNINLDILRDYYREYKPQYWLFPGQNPEIHLSSRTPQKEFRKARIDAGIAKEASLHTLRHCFATHLLDAGVDLVYIQQLMGHASIKTTSLYLHLRDTRVLKIKSPLIP
ncbi:MAG: integrase [Firmicutes bacterium]|nr:integrase [Bacillota bacterium]